MSRLIALVAFLAFTPVFLMESNAQGGRAGAPAGTVVQPPPRPVADPSTRGSIQGVVRTPSGQSVRDIEVVLNGPAPTQGAPGIQRTTKTDTEGRFSFSDLPGGRYQVRATDEKYFAPSEPPLPVATVAITNATPNPRVTLSVVAGGIISGRLTDAQGRPLAGVTVIGLRAGYADGKLQLSANNNGFKPQVTNDRGEYRLYWVPPDEEYYIRTDGGFGSTGYRPLATDTTAQLLSYYPSGTDPARAVPVKVRPGEELTGMDFQVEVAPVFKISGTVSVLVPGGRKLANGQVDRSISFFYLGLQNPGPAQFLMTLQQTRVPRNLKPDQVDIPFELLGVAPGSYYLRPTFSDGRVSHATRIPFTVIDADVKDLRGEIRASELIVRVIMKGASSATPAWIPTPLNAPIILRSVDSWGPGLAPEQAADGSMKFSNAIPGEYKILVPGVPRGFYVADIRHGSNSLNTNNTIVLSGGTSEPVEVTISSGAGAVQGIVRSSRGQASAAAVTLVPQLSQRSNSMLYKRARASAEGVFTINDLAPGEYKIFAWEDGALPSGAEENAAFLARFENRGRAVTVRGGSTVDVTLDAIAR